MWVFVSLSWGTLLVFTARAKAPSQIRKDENSWGFGQIIPLLLLILPLIAVLEAFYGSCNNLYKQ